MPNDHVSTDDRPETGATPDAHRRRLLTLVGGAGVTLLAGCASNVDLGGGAGATGGDGVSGEAGGAADAASTGTFRLLISDRPVAIDEFDRLDVSFDRARVFRSGGGGNDGEDDEAIAAASPTATEAANATATESPSPTTSPTPTATESPTSTATESPTPTTTESPTATANATANGNATATETVEPTENATGEGDDGDGEQNGFSVIDLDGATVDLTTVVGAKATGIFEGQLPEGRYTKIELYAADVEGVVDGEVVDVTVPSGKLMLTKPFEVAAGATLSFVFDITVVEKGKNGYNLLPVVGESGVAGEDVETEEVEAAAADEGTATATGTDDDGSDGTQTDATEQDETEEESGDGGQGTGANGPPEGSG